MEISNHLYILWTNADPITADYMVFMYAKNSLISGWWEDVTIIIWGATAKLINDNSAIQHAIQDLISSGVNLSACKACAEKLGVSKSLEQMGIEVKYWGEPLTEILKSKATLLTI